MINIALILVLLEYFCDHILFLLQSTQIPKNQETHCIHQCPPTMKNKEIVDNFHQLTTNTNRSKYLHIENIARTTCWTTDVSLGACSRIIKYYQHSVPIKTITFHSNYIWNKKSCIICWVFLAVMPLNMSKVCCHEWQLFSARSGNDLWP